jgi:hypothetical protein
VKFLGKFRNQLGLFVIAVGCVRLLCTARYGRSSRHRQDGIVYVGHRLQGLRSARCLFRKASLTRARIEIAWIYLLMPFASRGSLSSWSAKGIEGNSATGFTLSSLDVFWRSALRTDILRIFWKHEELAHQAWGGLLRPSVGNASSWVYLFCRAAGRRRNLMNWAAKVTMAHGGKSSECSALPAAAAFE